MDDQTIVEMKTLPFGQSEAAFEAVFKTHFKALHRYAFTFVKDSDVAEDMVQNTFVKLWEKSETLHIHTSISAYLYRSVNHECLNYLKHEKVKTAHADHVKHSNSLPESNATSQLQLQELETKLSDSLAKLPEGCRTIFQMSRFESLKYREIAEKLGISVKTVENQMGKALKTLRLDLIDYLPMMLLIIFMLLNI